MTKFIFSLASIFFCGCTTLRYVNIIDPSQTRKIGSDDIAALPAKITVAELFKRWGPAAGGKELIFQYRSKVEGINLLVFVEFLDGPVEESRIGSADVTKMIFIANEQQFPATAWTRHDPTKEIPF